MSKIAIVDVEFAPLLQYGLALAGISPQIIEVKDPEHDGACYEDSLTVGDPDLAWLMPADEWDAISINYSSGTTGPPSAWFHITAAPTFWHRAMR